MHVLVAYCCGLIPWNRKRLLLLLAAILVAGRSFGAEYDPQRFERTVVQPQLVQPMELDIAPDGRIFVIELGGSLKLIDARAGTCVEVAKIEVTTAQENGLIGLALDPDFATNGWIYLQYSPPDFPGQHISRFNFRDDRLDLASERVLFKYEEQRRECCHHAGSLEFGPDGTLYIGTGDNTNPFNDSEGFAPLDQRENREPWDAQRTAGNTKSYNGKILRIRPEPDGTYSIPDGNLFPKDGLIGHPEIFVMGCRNPWRINIDQRTGFLYWGDVGPDAGSDGPRGPRGYDEINQARKAGNFGWPYFIGDNFAYSIVDFASGEVGQPLDPVKPINLSVNNTGSPELPSAQPAMIYYPSGPSELFPEVLSGGRTACAGPVYNYDPSSNSLTKFPIEYDRTLFAFEWSRNWILAVHLDQDSKVQRLEQFLPEMKFVRPIDLQFDANGSLYVIEYGETWGVNQDAQLIRIDYVRGNRAPRAVAKAENSIGREPLTVHFDGCDSADKDNDTLTYRWSYVRTDQQQQQRRLISENVTASHTFEAPGVYTIELEVIDPSGASNAATLPVIVGNSRPHVEFLEPQDGDFVTLDAPLRYRVMVRDVEDGTSDFEQAEEEGWHLIESHAPSRLFVEAIPVETSQASEPVHPGLALIRKSDCFNCHAPTRKLVGPSFVEIADKYRDQPHQLELSTQRVRNGSTGVWGKVGMLPHQQHTEAEVYKMVEYVFSQSADTSNPIAQGFSNVLGVQSLKGSVRLEVSYTDLGRDQIPQLVGVATVSLRSRKLQAEAADHFEGTQPLGSGNAEGGYFMGAINHDAYLRFDDLRLDSLQAATVRVTSAGAGGWVEFRRGSPEGVLMGKVQVEVNGSWDAFHDLHVDLSQQTGRDSLFIVFKNEQQRGGLMNIDSIAFD